MIDLFLVWWVVVLAIGLAVLYRRRTGPVALSLLGAYVGIAAYHRRRHARIRRESVTRVAERRRF